MNNYKNIFVLQFLYFKLDKILEEMIGPMNGAVFLEILINKGEQT